MIDIDAARARIDEWTRLAAWGIKDLSAKALATSSLPAASTMLRFAERSSPGSAPSSFIDRRRSHDRQWQGSGPAALAQPNGSTEMTSPIWIGFRPDTPTTTSRMLIVGPTGLGKTMFGLAVAFAVASGTRASCNGKQGALVACFISTARFSARNETTPRDAVHREGKRPDDLVILSTENYPDMPPLNIPEGRVARHFISKQIFPLLDPSSSTTFKPCLPAT